MRTANTFAIGDKMRFRKLRIAWTVTCGLLCLLLLAAPSICAVQEENLPAIFRGIQQTWQTRKTAIKTAKFKFHYFLKGETSLKALSPEQVCDLLKDYAASTDTEKKLKELIRAIRAESLAAEEPWIDATFAT